MIKLRDISIRNKLVIIQVFASVLVLGIFFAVYVITDIRAYKKRKSESMLNLAQVVATNTISTLQFEDNEAARQILVGLHNVEPDIIFAGILDKNGSPFATYTKNSTAKSPRPDLVNKGNIFFLASE